MKKTLYVNLNGEDVVSDAQVEVVLVDLDFNFWLCLGEQLSSELRIDSRSALLSRFVEECPEAAEPLLDVWEERKEQVLGDSPAGSVPVTLDRSYFHWLKFSDMPQAVRDRYRDREELTLDVDVEELAEMVLDDVRRVLRRSLNDTVEEVVFNHPAVTRRSPLVRFLKKCNENLVFVPFDRWTWPEAPSAESHVEKDIIKTKVQRPAIKSQKDINDKLQLSDLSSTSFSSIRILVCGCFNSGKSTLINRLSGAQIAHPEANFKPSPTIIEYKHSISAKGKFFPLPVGCWQFGDSVDIDLDNIENFLQERNSLKLLRKPLRGYDKLEIYSPRCNPSIDWVELRSEDIPNNLFPFNDQLSRAKIAIYCIASWRRVRNSDINNLECLREFGHTSIIFVCTYIDECEYPERVKVKEHMNKNLLPFTDLGEEGIFYVGDDDTVGDPIENHKKIEEFLNLHFLKNHR